MRILTHAINSGRRSGRSLRLQLTLWMLAIFLVIQLGFALVLQLYQSRSINRYFDDRLGARLTAVAQSFRTTQRNIDNAWLDEIATREQRMLNSGLTLTLLDSSGRVIAASRAATLVVTAEQLERAARAGGVVAIAVEGDALDVEQPPDLPVRGAMAVLNTDDGKRSFLVLVADDEQATRMLSLVTRIILFGIPFGLVAMAVSAYLIAGIAVRPLTGLTEAARRLTPETIGERMSAPSSAAEVAELHVELEHARKRIEAGFATQERFLSNVSHELKTPIATILTEIQLIKAAGLPAEVREFLRSETEELERMSHTVDSFLLLTRVRYGKAQIPSAERCHIRDVLLESYASCAPFARQHGVRLELALPDNEHADAAVRGNADLLKIIFDNIIRNAVRFSPRDSAVSVRAEVLGSDLLIRVRDRGPGVPPELIPHIFEHFTQSKEEQRRGRGHGLGLEIAMGIAQLHLGTISVENCSSGGGCEFTVRLPRMTGTA